MKKLYFSAEVGSEKTEDGVDRYFRRDLSSAFETREEAVERARKSATKHIGDTYGVFELTGTVIHPIPELDVTAVA